MLLVPDPIVLGATVPDPIALPEPMALLSLLEGGADLDEGLLMGVGVTGVVLASSVFLPQAARASKAAKVNAVTTAG